MSLESGGRADKYGNQYENRYLAKLLLRLVNELFVSIVVEPVGLEGDGVEFITTDSDGNKTYYQCKASNTIHAYWSIYDLERYKVFERTKNIVSRSNQNFYFFVSPLQYNGLDELCKRARTNSSSQEFVKYQLSNTQLKDTFTDCANYYRLDIKDSLELKQLINILAHCYFEQYPTGIEAEKDLEERVGMYFTGRASTARQLLEQYVNDTGKFGVIITAKDVVDYMAYHDIHIRNYRFDNNVLSRIHCLNEVYWGVYQPIDGQLIHRTATESIIEQIKKGHSVILHGKAGSGKSGCIQEVINYLKASDVLYLSIKLDKISPEVSADKYGIKLGLLQSPVYCLHTLSGGKECVLILDQLDSLRWTGNHSARALDVCKEMLAQAEAINTEGGKISIIFVTRTFDLENDKGLQSLFDKKISDLIIWEKICVDLLSDKNVQDTIGEDYPKLSKRLKVLLRTPSSLFVWSRLDKRAKTNSITSVYQLMDEWWNQVLENSEINGFSQHDVQLCKDDIVTKMSENTVFALPVYLYSDSQKIIDLFVSAGLLIKNENVISFTHQSFLDYFIACGTMRKIYAGKELFVLIGGEENQTPNLHYRLLTVLQGLLDSDRAIFLKQSKGILEAKTVRHYFKCAVFEVVGQCDKIDEATYSFVDFYRANSEWHDYVIQTVYMGHPLFIEQLNASQEYKWMEDEGISLLISINSKAPDFVVDILLPYSFLDEKKDKKIFSTLCFNAADDSDNMFEFRMKLLNHHVELYDHFLFYSLIESKSQRAVAVMKALLQERMMWNSKSMYFGEKEVLKKYACSNYEIIVKDLSEEICKATSTFLPPWPHFNFDKEYQLWTESEYDESPVRKIVTIVKEAFEKFALRNPKGMLSFLINLNSPKSVVGQELIAHAISKLPISYSDEAIKWLLSDFKYNVFVFTGDQSDYLSYTKEILKKYSPSCDECLFHELEQAIYNWKDDSKRMVSIYKRRLETNQQKKWEPMYYAYWGHFQKELLPFMDSSRLASYSKELLGVLNRNSWIRAPFYYSGFRIGSAKFVASPIDGYANKLGDKSWLKIISTPLEKMKGDWGRRETDEYYIEATHAAFSSSLSTQAKKQPARFARLALSFPENCYDGYIYSVMNALDNRDIISEAKKASIELSSKVIRKYSNNLEPNMAMSIARLIEHRADEEWPDDIIDLLVEIALEHADLKYNNCLITEDNDPENCTPQSLLTMSINCASGCALRAIAQLLWEHREIGQRIKELIIQINKNSNDIIRVGILFCIVPFYNIDPEFAVTVFENLLSNDLRLLAMPGTFQLVSNDYCRNQGFYRAILIKACNSDIEELAICAAGFVCAMAIFFNDKGMLNYILTYDFSPKQENRICSQAASSFNQEKYHELSKRILTYLIDTSSSDLQNLSHLFKDGYIIIERDKEFLINLMQSKQSTHQVRSFLSFINKSDEDIIEFADVFKAVSKGITRFPTDWSGRLIVNDLIQCVIRLFDRGKGNVRVRGICLDIWDELYKSNLQDIKPLSEMIDNF